MAAATITTTTINSDPTALLRLLQLSSPALPIGAYAYSQGLEYAVAEGWLNDQTEVEDWLRGLLHYPLRYLDCPVLQRLYAAWHADDREQLRYWNDFLNASRETRELQQEDHHLGGALVTLLAQLEVKSAQQWPQAEQCCFATAFSLAAVQWKIALNDTVYGYLWCWVENQVMAAVKLVPLGQTAGQQIVSNLLPVILETVAAGLALPDSDIGCTTPGLALASARHETQYTRLFRS